VLIGRGKAENGRGAGGWFGFQVCETKRTGNRDEDKTETEKGELGGGMQKFMNGKGNNGRPERG